MDAMNLSDKDREAIAEIASVAVSAAEGGWGASELVFALESIAELATEICSKYKIEYQAADTGDEVDDKPVMTTEQWIA